MSQRAQPAHIVVLGGGITGLVAAWRLVRSGVHVSLLERSDRLGGVIETQAHEGAILEQGPFSVLVRSPVFAELIEDVGLDPIMARGKGSRGRYILKNDRLLEVPGGPAGLLTTPLLSMRGRLRLLGGLVRSRPASGDDECSIHEFASRRLGEEAADVLAGAATMGIFAAEATELGFTACMPRFAEADRTRRSVIGMMKAIARPRPRPRPRSQRPAIRGTVSFDGGLRSLIEAIEKRIMGEAGPRKDAEGRAEIRRGVKVQQVDRAEGGFHVIAEGEGAFEADGVLSALPRRATAAIFKNLLPEIALDLDQMDDAGLVVVHVAIHHRALDSVPEGFGFLVPPAERRCPLLGVIYASSVFPHHLPDGSGLVLLRAMLGGTRSPDSVEWDDDRIRRAILQTLDQHFGLRGEPAWVTIRRWPGAIPVYRVGHAARMRRIAERAGKVPGLVLAGNWTGGLGINDRVEQAAEQARRLSAAVSLNTPA